MLRCWKRAFLPVLRNAVVLGVAVIFLAQVAGAVPVRTPRPDLRMMSVARPPGLVSQSESFITRDLVANAGSRTAAASLVRYYLRPTAGSRGRDVRLAGSRRVGRLGPRRRSRGQARVGIPAITPPGTYRLVACADNTHIVRESNERNNCRGATGQTHVLAATPRPPPAPQSNPAPPPAPQSNPAPPPAPQSNPAPVPARDMTAPSTPGNLVATAGDGSTSLRWDASTDSYLVGYRIYRRNADGTWPSTPLATRDAATRSYMDSGLSNGTAYTYRVTAFDQAGNESTPSNIASATPTAPVIAAAGDIACDSTDQYYNGGNGTTTPTEGCRQHATSDLLTGGGLAAVLPLGDEQYGASTLTNFQSFYGPTWGRVKPATHPVPGNHEYNSPTPNAEGYFDYFDGVGSSSGLAGDRGKGYYSYDIGPWHLVALNSSDGCTTAIVDCSSSSAQVTWLRRDLAAHSNQCVLAYWHHPLFTSGTAGSTANVKPLWQALYDYGADVVLNGHQHSYERYDPLRPDGSSDPTGGIREFVVGTGGKSRQGWATSQPSNERVRDNTTMGVLDLTLHASSYDWNFQHAAGSGTFTDSGHADCH